MTAIEYHKDPSRFDSLTKRQTMDKLHEKLRSMGSSNLFGLIGGDLAGAENLEAVSVPMQKMAQILVQAGGLNAEKALEEAAKSVSRGFKVVNGNAVYTGDRQVPPDFGQLATQHIENFATLTKERYGYDKGDLTIRPLNNQNAWIVVDKATQLPVSFGSDGVITMDDLAKIKTQNAEKARADAEAKSRDRYKPIFTAPGGVFSIDRPNLSGYTPAEVKRLEEERKKANDAAAAQARTADEQYRNSPGIGINLGKQDTLDEFRARNRKNLGLPDRGPAKKQ
jgi:hypothetical protein